MTMTMRGLEHDSDVLIRQVLVRLGMLRERPDLLTAGDLARVEQLAENLCTLVDQTATASAVDRARVRVAVHRFIGARPGVIRSGRRSLAEEVRVINAIARSLGRADLLV